ncbi:hypothetical protein TcWFU_007716 [Taenia crassiceps]|uniref:Uncharacterized protein n=1 Tax=Taenia crassiceps TaxID=6207 RepID=A0ABR4Q1F3_9CEST
MILVLPVDRCHVVVKNTGMLWRKRNTQHDSPCPESLGGREGGSSDDNPPPVSNSPCPSPSQPQLQSNEAALTFKLAKEMEHFQLLKWNACAFWSWDVMHDTCVICRNAMMSLFNVRMAHEWWKGKAKWGRKIGTFVHAENHWRESPRHLIPLHLIPPHVAFLLTDPIQWFGRSTRSQRPLLANAWRPRISTASLALLANGSTRFHTGCARLHGLVTRPLGVACDRSQCLLGRCLRPSHCLPLSLSLCLCLSTVRATAR